MELYQLRTFVAVAREGNLSRASERLFTSQPAISAQVKALEDELGVRLFERSARGMRLTAPGSLLLGEAEKALAAASGVIAQARQLQGQLSGELRLGTVSDPVTMRLGEFMSRLAAAHPQLVIRLTYGHSGKVIDGLRRGELDAGYAVGELNDAGLQVWRLGVITLRVAAPAAWRDRIDGADFKAIASLPWITTPPTCSFHPIAQALFAAHGLPLPKSVAEADQEVAMRSLVAAGVGVSLLRDDQARAGIEAGELAVWPGAAPTTYLNFLLRAERAAEPLLAAALVELRATWPEAALV